MPINNAWNSPPFSAYQVHNWTGISSWSGAGAYYSISGTDFTVLRGGSGYIKTTPLSWTGPQTVSGLAAGDTYYVYINSSGVIGSTSARNLSLFENNIVLFEVLVDSTAVTPVVIAVREDHPVNVQSDISEWAHIALGPLISNINNGANIVKNGTTGIQINGTDYLLDHGLTTTIPDSAAAAVTWNHMYTNAAGKWVRYLEQAAFPSRYNSAGTPTALSGGNRGIFRLYVSKDDLNASTPKYFSVMHTAQYSNITQARNAITAGVAAATNELYNLELAQLGYVIFSSAVIEEVQISKSVARFFPAGGGATSTANLISTSTVNFNGWLGSTESNVQTALDELDNSTRYTEVTGASQTLAINRSYTANRGTLITFTLPTTAKVGDEIAITGVGAGGWTIAQNANQYINIVASTTTIGVGGSLSSTQKFDSVKLVCVVANLGFNVVCGTGNWTIV
jgi:hypothetical protein